MANNAERLVPYELTEPGWEASYSGETRDTPDETTDGQGNVLSTSGPLLTKDLDPKVLDYDEYWNAEVQAKLPDFERITRDDYLEILRKNEFPRFEASVPRLF